MRWKHSELHSLMRSLGYTVFTEGAFNVNIVGIRNRNGRVNSFDDSISVSFRTPDGRWMIQEWPATTDPGAYYLENPMKPSGTAILKSGQYRGSHKIGLHRGQYEALVQKGPLTMFLDGNRDKVLDFGVDEYTSGSAGINIHRAAANSVTVDRWSAGCQVLARASDFGMLMSICHKQIEVGLGNSFTYTLLEMP